IFHQTAHHASDVSSSVSSSLQSRRSVKRFLTRNSQAMQTSFDIAPPPEGGVVTTDLITRARAGDDDAFRALTEPHRRELLMHCYRMLGSFQDAEDALQDTLLAAWQGLRAFEGRASIRTWLYRIATRRCLNALRSATRRPAKEWPNPEVEPPEPSRLGE